MTTLQWRMAFVFARQMVDGKPERGLQAEIARLCGVSRPTVSAWFNNEGKVATMERVYAEKICARYRPDISAAWLADDILPKAATAAKATEPMDATLSIVDDKPPSMGLRAPAPDDFEIVQYEAGGAMGTGLVLEDQPPGHIKSWRVDQEWLRLNVRHHTGTKNLCIVTGFGPSMRPKYNPGDPLLMDRGVTRVDHEGVYFFRVGDHGFIKQLQRIPTEAGLIIRVKSFNTDYDPWEITEKMDFEVFGKILTVWKSEQF